MSELDLTNLPRHVAIIMDGNGRWANERKLDRTQGHIEGVKRVEEISDYANDIGIKVLTLYTFSTENWNRPQSEVSTLMDILTAVLKMKVEKLKRTNIRFRTIGSAAGLPEKVKSIMDSVMEDTKNCTGLTLNLAFNYGARREIIEAVRKISEEVKAGKFEPSDIDEKTISNALYTKDLPDPDLLIRTSGELRISNFLLWQLSYAEFYFTQKFWPDFHIHEFQEAIIDYQGRDRRFGNLNMGARQS